MDSDSEVQDDIERIVNSLFSDTESERYENTKCILEFGEWDDMYRMITQTIIQREIDRVEEQYDDINLKLKGVERWEELYDAYIESKLKANPREENYRRTDFADLPFAYKNTAKMLYILDGFILEFIERVNKYIFDQRELKGIQGIKAFKSSSELKNHMTILKTIRASYEKPKYL